MGSLSGTIGDLVGDTITPARHLLVPADLTTLSGGEVRLGGYQITVAADGTFNVAGVPDGTYTLQVRYWHPLARRWVSMTTDSFAVAGATSLATALA